MNRRLFVQRLMAGVAALIPGVKLLEKNAEAKAAAEATKLPYGPGGAPPDVDVQGPTSGAPLSDYGKNGHTLKLGPDSMDWADPNKSDYMVVQDYLNAKEQIKKKYVRKRGLIHYTEEEWNEKVAREWEDRGVAFNREQLIDEIESCKIADNAHLTPIREGSNDGMMTQKEFNKAFSKRLMDRTTAEQEIWRDLYDFKLITEQQLKDRGFTRRPLPKTYRSPRA